MDEEHELVVSIPSFRFRWINVLIAVFACITDFFDTIGDLLMAHANYGVDKARVQNEMRADIERIVNE